MIWDIAIIGGGASGLMAARTAAEVLQNQHKPYRILVLERMNKLGKKLLATGNGRCNLTNVNAVPAHYHGDTALAEPILAQYPSKWVQQSFQKLGLLCRQLDEGRVYPYSLQASSVLDTLRAHLEQLGVTIACEMQIEEVLHTGSHYVIKSTDEIFQTKQVIITTGGKASSKLGSDGSGFSILKTLGHSVTPLYPSLIQLKTDAKRAKPLKGARSFADVSLYNGTQPLQTSSGEVQFTEYGLSGICVFELSRLAAELLSKKSSLSLSLDLAPQFKPEELYAFLEQTCRVLPESPSADLLNGILNKLVGRELMRQTLPTNKPIKQLKPVELHSICKTIKSFSFPITGTMPWENAQVTAGGIPLAELNVNRMESKKHKGLYLAGEILNIDGDCGGFNLHWAWISGCIAGRSAAVSF